MRCVVQRVTRASVTIKGVEKRSIGRGLAILIGVTHSDTAQDADQLADKIAGLRIFNDTSGKMNLSVMELDDPQGEFLVVSQFTLYGDARKGRRPSFVDAANGAVANELYERFVSRIEQSERRTQTGEFGADMLLELINDGPVTILLDSSKLF